MESRNEGSTLAVVPLTSDLWRQFIDLHNSQGSVMVGMQPTQNGIWVVGKLMFDDPSPSLVVGCVIYDTDGSMVIAEHLVSNPAFPVRVRFHAFDLALDMLRAFATVHAKHVIAHPTIPGLARYLERRGFRVCEQVVATLSAPPGVRFSSKE